MTSITLQISDDFCLLLAQNYDPSATQKEMQGICALVLSQYVKGKVIQIKQNIAFADFNIKAKQEVEKSISVVAADATANEAKVAF